MKYEIEWNVFRTATDVTWTNGHVHVNAELKFQENTL